MARNKLLNALVLYPASRLYGFGVAVRNLMFKWGFLKSRQFPVPVIVVGNIAVGGTGKTPHAEYIIAMLKRRYHVGILSRGYRRATKGFVPVTSQSTPLDVGDEPYQMYHKLADSDTFFAVCENRCEGIERMLQADPKINVIVLDDAFQHRYVKPAVAVVLTEFGRPVFYDHLLPYGRLREPVDALDRADMVIVTKCPEQLKPLEYRIFKNNLKLFHYQKLFFSRFVYREPRPLFPDSTMTAPVLQYLEPGDALMALTGIANPKPFTAYLRRFKPSVKKLNFPDHHNFSRSDMERIAGQFKALEGRSKYIITTEKDAVRLINNPYFPIELRPYIFFVPIEVQFEDRGTDSFDDTLMKLIRNASLTRPGSGTK